MNPRHVPALALPLALLALACGKEEGQNDTRTAVAALKDNAGQDIGSLRFSQVADGPVLLEIQIGGTSTQATPGPHGLHIHTTAGKCEPPTFASAGAHWNPEMTMHGSPLTGEHHGGDLGNITVRDDKTGRAGLTLSALTLAEGAASSIVGLPVIFHAGTDDLLSQPGGNSGARAGCGVITAE